MVYMVLAQLYIYIHILRAIGSHVNLHTNESQAIQTHVYLYTNKPQAIGSHSNLGINKLHAIDPNEMRKHEPWRACIKPSASTPLLTQ